MSVRSPTRSPIPQDPDSVLPPTFILNFYFSSKRISEYYFFWLPWRDLPTVIYLCLCLGLTALTWSLPHFQAHVIMFSVLLPRPPKSLVSSTQGEGRGPLPLFLWVIVTRTLKSLLLSFPTAALVLFVSLGLVPGKSLIHHQYFKLDDLTLKEPKWPAYQMVSLCVCVLSRLVLGKKSTWIGIKMPCS